MSALLFLLLPIALFLLLVRPQRQRVNAQRTLLSGLGPGEEVITSGGLIGTVVAIGEGEASIEVAPGTVVRVVLAAVIGRPRPPQPDATSLRPDATSLRPDATSLRPDATSLRPDATSLRPDATSHPDADPSEEA